MAASKSLVLFLILFLAYLMILFALVNTPGKTPGKTPVSTPVESDSEKVCIQVLCQKDLCDTSQERVFALEEAKNLSRNIELVVFKKPACDTPLVIDGFWEFVKVSGGIF
jgi:hypothetical protein